jgi:hypothetical protein
MPKRGSLELQGLVDRAYRLFQHERMTASQIAEILTDEGYQVSRSGVARAIRKRKLDMKRFDEALESAQAIVKATEGRPGTDIGEAALQLTLTKLLDELKATEDFRDMDNEQVILATSRISRSLAAVSRLKLDYERGYKAGLFKMRDAAAEEAGKEAKRLGMSDEDAAAICNKILRLGDGSA